MSYKMYTEKPVGAAHAFALGALVGFLLIVAVGL
jgi:hypothetical protein